MNLDANDCTDLARFLREAIEADRFPLSPRVKRWKELLAKLAPPAEPATPPFPPPKPSDKPSHTLGKNRLR